MSIEVLENICSRKLGILGAGGHGRVCADIARQMQRWTDIHFFDDNPKASTDNRLKIIGSCELVYDHIDEYDFFVAIGNNSNRMDLQLRLQKRGAVIATLRHPHSIIAGSSHIGIGSVVMAGAVVGVDVEIGNACIINTSCSIDHDCFIGDGSHISPGAHLGGGVMLGKGCWIGIGACVRDHIVIEDECIVGAGGVVVHDLQSGFTYVGSPARRMLEK